MTTSITLYIQSERKLWSALQMSITQKQNIVMKLIFYLQAYI